MTLFLILAVLQAIDVWTTYANLKRPDRHEANPLMAKAFKEIGFWPTMIVLKCGVVALAYFILLPHTVIMLPLCAFYTLIVANNFRLLKEK